MKKIIFSLSFLFIFCTALFASDPEVIFNRAKLLWEEARVKESLKLFISLKEDFPSYKPKQVQWYMCRGYEKIGNFEKALDECEKYVANFPWAKDRIEVLMRMAAIAEVALEDLDRAWKYLSSIDEAEVSPFEMPPLLFNKAYLLEKMKRFQDAILIYQRLIKEYPDSLGAHWAKQRLEALRKIKNEGE